MSSGSYSEPPLTPAFSFFHVTDLKAGTAHNEAAIYINMTESLRKRRAVDGVSITVYTQITDVELVCLRLQKVHRAQRMTPTNSYQHKTVPNPQ